LQDLFSTTCRHIVRFPVGLIAFQFVAGMMVLVIITALLALLIEGSKMIWKRIKEVFHG